MVYWFGGVCVLCRARASEEGGERGEGGLCGEGGEGRRRKGKEGRRKTRGGKEGVGDMNHHGLNALDHGWSAC